MKTVRRIEMYLMEDVPIAPADCPIERMFVPHNLSPDQGFETVLHILKSLKAILTPEELRDRLAILERALAELRSDQEIERGGRDRLTIREA